MSKVDRATDAKEVGVGNPAEETYCRPNRVDFYLEHGRKSMDFIKEPEELGTNCARRFSSLSAWLVR